MNLRLLVQQGLVAWVELWMLRVCHGRNVRSGKRTLRFGKVLWDSNRTMGRCARQLLMATPTILLPWPHVLFPKCMSPSMLESETFGRDASAKQSIFLRPLTSHFFTTHMLSTLMPNLAASLATKTKSLSKSRIDTSHC